jgi:hypothetical protein
LNVTIQDDHRVEVQLPADFPEGPAEIIVLTTAGDSDHLSAQQRMLATLTELRSVELTPDEEATLDAFGTFRKEHPFRLASLNEEI